ncbi:hypothetical protein N7486_000322 [Penicillium sp. IBT 16267x]|nr:hypothetical protein N7486_000322 [Penicillium sp. IBT 16267x]
MTVQPISDSYHYKEITKCGPFVKDMWKSKSYLDRDYGSALTISLNDPCHEIYYGEEQPLMRHPTASSDHEEGDEVNGRRLAGFLFAIVCFTCVGTALAIFFAISNASSHQSGDVIPMI